MRAKPKRWRSNTVMLLTLALLAAAYRVLKPTPPRRVVLATGVAQSTYREFGKHYADLLKRHGIDVELRATQGTAENLALLRDGQSGVDLAFVHGGADSEREAEATASPTASDDALVSLGSVCYEPVWLFYRQAAAQRLMGDPTLTRLSQLTGGTFNIGAPGSGAPPLLERLLAANDIAPGGIALQRQSLTPAVIDLLEGRLDALALASAPESLMVQMLLRTPGIGLLDFAQG